MLSVSVAGDMQNKGRLFAEIDVSPNKCSPDDINRKNSSKNSSENGHRYTRATSYTPPSMLRRGRPPQKRIADLIVHGTQSDSEIKCLECYRVFPRLKSLQAHIRIHTGVKAFKCDYPLCVRKFTQSGQLRTHERTHTVDKPFKCVVHDCKVRHTHSNRTCNVHPPVPGKKCLVRVEEDVEEWKQRSFNEKVRTLEEVEWLNNFFRNVESQRAELQNAPPQKRKQSRLSTRRVRKRLEFDEPQVPDESPESEESSIGSEESIGSGIGNSGCVTEPEDLKLEDFDSEMEDGILDQYEMEAVCVLIMMKKGVV